MNQSLTVSEIKNLFSSSTYRKGHSYYIQGRVKNLAYDSVRTAWYAEVMGTKRYLVEVQEDEIGFEFDCNCPAFERYGEECKHVAAVMIKIQETESNREHATSGKELLQMRQLELKRQQEELVRQQQARGSGRYFLNEVSKSPLIT